MLSTPAMMTTYPAARGSKADVCRAKERNAPTPMSVSPVRYLVIGTAYPGDGELLTMFLIYGNRQAGCVVISA